MSYRPITDIWLLARPKVKYYGAYPNGFLERARILLGCSFTDSIFHVCSGMASSYPNKGFGPNDETLDIDKSLNPTYVCDVRTDFPSETHWPTWKAILVDQPYTEEDADHYRCGRSVLPNPNDLLKKCIRASNVGRCVGFLHYKSPTCPANAKFVACIAVFMGYNNNIRCFSVYQKLKD